MVHKGYLQDFDLFDKMILVNYEIENEHSSNCLHRNLHEIDNYPILIKIKIDVSYSSIRIFFFCLAKSRNLSLPCSGRSQSFKYNFLNT